MSVDLKLIEKNAWLASFQDGLLDLILGAVLTIVGISGYFDSINIQIDLFTPLLFIAIIGTVFVVKRNVVLPRAGKAKFKKPRYIAMIIMVSIQAILLLTQFILFAVAYNQKGSTAQLLSSSMMWLVYCVLFFGIPALIIGLPRLFVYGIMYGIAFSFNEIMAKAIGIGSYHYLIFVIFGLIMVIIGIIVFIRFLKMNPYPSELVTNETSIQ